MPPAPLPMPISGPTPQLNDAGLPLRPGKEQCLLYLNTGNCPNGIQCIFDHSKGGGGGMKGVGPKAGGGPGLPPGLVPPGPVPGAAGGLPTFPGGAALPLPGGGAKAAVSPPSGSSAPPPLPVDAQPPAPAEQRAGGVGKADGEKGFAVSGFDKDPASDTPSYNEEGLPIRTGMQKCGFFLRSGVCNYGPTCRFDHPAGLGGIMAGGSSFGHFPLMVGGPTTTEAGLARRPGKEQCPFLARTNSCPFGPECRFDHMPGMKTDDSAAVRPAPRPPPKPANNNNKDCGLGGQRGRRPMPYGGGAATAASNANKAGVGFAAYQRTPR